MVRGQLFPGHPLVAYPPSCRLCEAASTFPHLVNIECVRRPQYYRNNAVVRTAQPQHQIHFDLFELSAAECDFTFTSTDKQPEYQHTEYINNYPLPPLLNNRDSVVSYLMTISRRHPRLDLGLIHEFQNSLSSLFALQHHVLDSFWSHGVRRTHYPTL